MTVRTAELPAPAEADEVHPERVPLAALPVERLNAALAEPQIRELEHTVRRGRELLSGRVLWCVSSTARGGGVAEMLQSLLGYTRGAGVDARWMVIGGTPDFFDITKRIHNNLHGSTGDGGPLGDDERAVYEHVSEQNAGGLEKLVKRGDAVLLHDPQTAGLVPLIKSIGAHVIWRGHIGLDLPNDVARRAWRFLVPYVSEAHAYVFSRRAYLWDDLDLRRLAVIPPAIDAFSVKNKPLDPDVVPAILEASGLIGGRSPHAPVYERDDGSPGRVDRRATLLEDVHLEPDTPLVLQVSRWDRLKDPVGLMQSFVAHVLARSDAHLLFAGPDVLAVTDDPEGALVWEESKAFWQTLEPAERARVHLARLPMEDPSENAVIVNALQRHADVVVQKSLAEGFGLTVAEAMWKGRPVVGTRVGGIQDQIVAGSTGFLVDPLDLEAFGRAVVTLLADPARADRMGAAGRERVRRWFLGARQLAQYLELLERLISGRVRRPRLLDGRPIG
jgi:trehalose synthase